MIIQEYNAFRTKKNKDEEKMGKRKVITAVTSRVDFFVPYISSNFSYIRMGNDGASEIKGKIENICLETNIG